MLIIILGKKLRSHENCSPKAVYLEQKSAFFTLYLLEFLAANSISTLSDKLLRTAVG